MHLLKSKILKLFPEHISEEEFMLSIGTSKDWELAMLEGGANEIRIGTDIFGARDYSQRKASQDNIE